MEIKLDVFGKRVAVVKKNGGWEVFYLGGEGKRRRAHDIFVPPSVAESDVLRFVADLCHEWATVECPDVIRIG